MPTSWCFVPAALMLVIFQVLVVDVSLAQSSGDRKMLLVEEKDLSRRANDFWASNNSDDPKEIFSKSYINHQEPDAEGGEKELNLEAWLELVRGYHKAFSNSKVCILMQVAEGNLVATRWEFTAINTGDYMGHPPTGKEITWTGVQIDRFEDGKIAESWVNWDKFSFLEELGSVKQP